MTERSVKYAFFFIVLTFATVWLFEVLAKIRVHPIQYLLLGAALCLFYLLELSLSEHIGFVLAYILATSAVVAMVATYWQSGVCVLRNGVCSWVEAWPCSMSTFLFYSTTRIMRC